MATITLDIGGVSKNVGNYSFKLLYIFTDNRTGVGVTHIPTGSYGEYFVPCGDSSTICELTKNITWYPDDIKFSLVNIDKINNNVSYEITIGIIGTPKSIFKVTDLKIMDDTPAPHYFGDSIHLLVSVKNIGQITGVATVDVLRVEDSSCIHCSQMVYNIEPEQTKEFDFYWKLNNPILDSGLNKHIFAQARGGTGVSLYLDILAPGETPQPKLTSNIVLIILAAIAGGYLLSKPTEQKAPVKVYG